MFNISREQARQLERENLKRPEYMVRLSASEIPASSAAGADRRAAPLAQIGDAVQRFLAEAVAHPERSYFVTRIGCGIAGHRDSDIAPMFRGAPSNCSLPDTWAPYL